MTFARICACAALLSFTAGCAGMYTVNGQPTDPSLTAYMASAGLPPGAYWLDDRGNWGVEGSPIPLGNVHAQGGGNVRAGGAYGHGDGGYSYVSPGVYGGSGSVYGNGSWSHYSPHGGSVGGDGNGCVYAAGWSNC